MDPFDQEIANQRAAERLAREPHAIAARYDAWRRLMVITLTTGEDVRFALDQIRRLASAAAADLAEIEISPSGYGLHFPRLNADVWLPALRVQEQG
jgi:hypothetical protein